MRVNSNWGNVYVETHALRKNVSFSREDARVQGSFIKSTGFIGIGPYNTTYPYRDPVNCISLFTERDSPVQNIFPQRNTPPGPFQDLTVDNTGTQGAKLEFDWSEWVDPQHQKMVKVLITEGNSVFTAKYKLEVHNFIAGFTGNTWVQRTAQLPINGIVLSGHLNKTSNFRELLLGNKFNHAGSLKIRNLDDYSKCLIVPRERDSDTIAILDVVTADCLYLNKDYSPEMAFTSVSDAEITKDYIYVACSSTGLYRIRRSDYQCQKITSPTS